MASDTAIDTVRNDRAHRYEARLDGQVAGFVSFRSVPGRVILIHTEVDPTYEGRGVAGQLVASTLDDLRARGVAVTPQCPFVAEYIDRHPEYADLVAPTPPD